MPDEDAIRRAIADGSINESAYLDLKAAFGTTPAARKEMAKDLASFAIDGGQLLIGVGENKDEGSFFLSPVDLPGEVERIEQVATNRVDPSLAVRVREIPSSMHPGKGYLLVDIPVSPWAPHMVDNVYYARGERTTRRLNDAEVARLHALRNEQEAVADAALDEALAADPVTSSAAKLGHLFVVAQPLMAPQTVAEQLVWDGRNRLQAIVQSVEPSLPPVLRFSPSPSGSYPTNHARGAAIAAPALRDQPGSAGWMEKYLYEVVFREDGGIRAFVARATDELPLQTGRQAVVVDGVVLGYSVLVAHWAAQVGAATGYRGPWALGVLATGLQGLRSHRAYGDERFASSEPVYSEPEFRQTLIATGVDLEAPTVLGFRLARRLLRALGTEGVFKSAVGA